MAYVVVDPNGDDGTGVRSSTLSIALANPFQHLKEAWGVAGLAAGDTIYLRAGTHGDSTGEIVLETTSGSAGNPITITPYNNEAAIITNTSARMRVYTDYITFYECRWERNRGVSVGLQDATKYASNVIFDSCIWVNSDDGTGFNYPGPQLRNCDDITITNCWFENLRARVADVDSSAIVASSTGSSNSPTIHRITITDCTFIDIGSDGIEVQGAVGGCTIEDWLIEGNSFIITRPYLERDKNGDVVDPPTFTNVGENGIDFKGFTGVINAGTACVIKNNYFTGYRSNSNVNDCSGAPTAPAVNLHEHVKGVIVRGNQFRDNGSSISITKGSNGTSTSMDDFIVEGNVIIDGQPGHTPYHTNCKSIDLGACNNVICRHNIAWDLDYDSGAEARDVFAAYTGNVGLFLYLTLYNNIFINGETYNSGPYPPTTTDCTSNLWFNIAGGVKTDFVGTGDLSDDPLVDSNGIPSLYSPCRGAGLIRSSSTVDINNRPFNPNPTIGAYEYSANSPAQEREVSEGW